jgi:organic radical activating enzyme
MEQSLKVNEIFYSIQGEGARAGEPSIFIRLAGCDLACSFCDTEFESQAVMSLAAISQHISGRPCKWIVWTGGEPMLQINYEIVEFFHAAGYKQAIESNGNHAIPKTIDWRVVSPKVAEHVVKRHNPEGVDELRYVRHSGHMGVPQPAISAQFYYLSPIFNGNTPDVANVRHCMKLAMENPPWRLSLQLHKLLNVL